MATSFQTSTHFKCWMLSSATVAADRQAAHDAFLAKLAAAEKEEGAGPSPPPLPLEDGELLCAYYEKLLQTICLDEMRYSAEDNKITFTGEGVTAPHILSSAQAFYKRFYLKASPMEEEPKNVILAAIYLAGKVENYRIEPNELLSKYAPKLTHAAFLDLELTLMERLRFQLVVHSPFRCLSGRMNELQSASKGAIIELQQLDRVAKDTVCTLLRDATASFVHTPQQIALASLLAAADEKQPDYVDVRGWIETQVGSSGGGDGGAPLLAELTRIIKEAGCRFDLGSEETMTRLKAIDKANVKMIKYMRKIEEKRKERRQAAEAEQRKKQRVSG